MKVRTYAQGRLRNARAKRLYKSLPYLDAYTKDTDYRVRLDPEQAVGGMWDEIGTLQFQFLRGEGLLPEHTLLDVGCGTLRGGRHFISYLDRGNYTGFDISPAAIKEADRLVEAEGLKDRAPELVLSDRKTLEFTEFSGRRFDFLLAQSVFTHLMPETIEECFAHVGSMMGPRSRFYFTHNYAAELRQARFKDFAYPPAFFESLASEHGMALEDLSEHYPHPRAERMLKVVAAHGSSQFLT